MLAVQRQLTMGVRLAGSAHPLVTRLLLLLTERCDCMAAVLLACVGCPSPPLSLAVCVSSVVRRWLCADASHHLYLFSGSSVGRSLVLLVCYLLQSAECGSGAEAERLLSARFGRSVQSLLLPSQARYVEYLARIHDPAARQQQPHPTYKVTEGGWGGGGARY